MSCVVSCAYSDGGRNALRLRKRAINTIALNTSLSTFKKTSCHSIQYIAVDDGSELHLETVGLGSRSPGGVTGPTKQQKKQRKITTRNVFLFGVSISAAYAGAIFYPPCAQNLDARG